MVDLVKVKQTGPVAGTIGKNTGRGLLDITGVKPNTLTDTTGATNKGILKGLGVDLDTVLTPKGKRKKKAGLVGGDPEELVAQLGE